MPFSYDIIVCTYNGASFIYKQLESFFTQSILPSKIIISDDASTDDTLRIIDDFFKEKEFVHYQLVSGQKKGIICNFLSTLKYSNADYIFLSDQDDIWCKDKIREFSKIVKKTELPNLIFSDAKLIDENGKELAPSFFQYQNLTSNCMKDDSILYKNCVQGAACAINRPMQDLIIKSLEVIDIDKIYMHDWWFALLARYYGDYFFIGKPLLEYRQHSKNQIGVFNHKFRFIYYISRFSLYYRNFKKAISQKEELEKFMQFTGNNHLAHKSKRQYQYVPKIKKWLITLLRL